MKIAILSSYTVDVIMKEIDKCLKNHGTIVEWYISPFNQYRQEILSPDSQSKKFHPDFILLSLHFEELLNLSIIEIEEMLTRASLEYSSSVIFMHNVISIHTEPLQFLEWNINNSNSYRLSQINIALSDIAQKYSNIFLLDLEKLILTYGKEKMIDHRYYYLAKIYFSSFGNIKIAEQFFQAITAISGKRKKCLILDLDNTLWGGILGDEGIEHIKLSNDGEGKAFYDFQKYILKLYNTGIILAICSKNDEALAVEAIEKHPYMLLRKKYFASMKINWSDKATNICSIIQDLNIGFDSCVFFDDSPYERELIKSSLPDVIVPDLPSDFSEYPEFIARLPFFETFFITEEDIVRGKMYAQERERKDLFSQKNASMEDFLKSLSIKVHIQEASSFTIPRIAQLTQRTNQFNFTARRYTEIDIRSFLENPQWKVLSLSAADKIGDSGIVGVAILELKGETCRIDTFLISCRVLGRGIEEAFLSSILTLLTQWNRKKLQIEYIENKKNSIVRNFLLKHNINCIDNIYEIEGISCPEWIEVNYD